MLNVKQKIVSFEKEHRIVPKVIGAATALSCGVITVSATDGVGSVDISTVTDSLTSSLTDLVSKVAIACAAVVGAGLTIFGLKWCVKTIKSFFSKIAG